MPSKSAAQAAMMAKAATDSDYAKSRGIPQSVAQEFHAADQSADHRKLPERSAPSAPQKPVMRKPKGLLT